MSDERSAAEDWSEISRWFHDALAQPEAMRDAWITSQLADRPLLAAEVRSLLAALDDTDDRFEHGPLAIGDTASDSPLQSGQRIGVWTVRQRIGEGGMGTVYEAVRDDLDMPKRAALKTMRRVSNDALRRRFARERRILATLDHPNIAALLDGGTLSSGAPWFAMEFVDGLRIDRWCAQRALDVTARIRLMLQVCRAVQFAHQRLVVHRDLKPGNILVTEEGTVKLLDFGVAKLAASIADGDETATGALMVTADYASPEQLRGDPVTTASDVYSLGVVVFELLTGARPFAMQGLGLRDMTRLTESEAPRLSAVVSSVSAAAAGFNDADRLRKELGGDLEAVVGKMLNKDVARRYASIDDVQRDLIAWLESRPVSAQLPTTAYKLRRLAARHARTLTYAALLLTGGGISLSGVHWQTRQAARERARAAERLIEVRTLANTLVYDVNDKLAEVPGATELRASLVRTAVQSLDRASTDAPRDPALLRELAVAYQRAGDALGNPTQSNLGDLEGAMDAHTKAISIARTLVSNGPTDRNSLWVLALATEKAADVAAPLGKLDDALRYQRESLELFQRVARSDSGNVQYLRAVGISALKLGDLLGHPSFVNSGNTRAALSSYMDATRELDRAAAAGDTSSFVRRHQAIAQERLGRLHEELGNYPEARTALTQSLRARQQLMREAPRNVQARRDVAIAHYVLCGLALAERRPDQGLSDCEASLRIRTTLLSEDPTNGVLVRGMGIMHRRMGQLQAQRTDTAAALREYQRAVAFYEQYFGGKLGALNDRRDFAETLLERAELAALYQSARALALESFERARASYDSIATKMAVSPRDSARLTQVRVLIERGTK
ncbi:MAG: protein kinase [Gemmatimonadaceae bacterium]|nr:protein kinase [Gemmatimonadaceae bacterium]